jgi:N-acetyltransferase
MSQPAALFADRPLQLSGFGVQLRPLALSDAPALFAITPSETFRYFLSEPHAWTLDAFTQWLGAYVLLPEHVAFAVIDARTSTLVGSTTFLDISAAHRHAEIGITWYAHTARGTHINPACKLLLLEHAFERAFGGEGCLRVTLKCNSKNETSKRAIAKLGATYEGTLRNHRVKQAAGGASEVRDTAYFSVLPAEWPSVRERLTSRLRELGA